MCNLSEDTHVVRIFVLISSVEYALMSFRLHDPQLCLTEYEDSKRKARFYITCIMYKHYHAHGRRERVRDALRGSTEHFRE